MLKYRVLSVAALAWLWAAAPVSAQIPGGAGRNSSPTFTALTLTGTLNLGTAASDATHTDATVCRDTTSGLLLAGSGAAGICLGTSSLRFKRDVGPLREGLSTILALRPIHYRYRVGQGFASDRELYGFAAEQVAAVVPNLVGLDEGGRPNSVDWAGIVPILVRAIQEQQKEIDELKAAR